MLCAQCTWDNSIETAVGIFLQWNGSKDEGIFHLNLSQGG